MTMDTPNRPLVFAIAAVVMVQPAISAEATDQASKLQQVIDGITDNYRQIQTVRGKFQETHEDRSVKQQEVTTVRELPNGGRIEITQLANVWYNGQLTVRGDDYRVSTKRTDNEDSQIVTKLGTSWTFVNRRNGRNHRQTYSKDGLPGTSHVDPSEFPVTDIKDNIIEMLRESEVVQITDYKDERLGMLRRLVLRRPKGGSTSTWDFSRRLGFLPVRRTARWPNTDQILSVAQVTYQNILDGKAHYPQKFTRCYFDRNVTKDAESNEWRQQMRWTLTKIEVNVSVDRDLKD